MNCSSSSSFAYSSKDTTGTGIRKPVRRSAGFSFDSYDNMGVRIIEGQRTQPACISVEFEIYLGLFIIYDFQLNPHPILSYPIHVQWVPP